MMAATPLSTSLPFTKLRISDTSTQQIGASSGSHGGGGRGLSRSVGAYSASQAKPLLLTPQALRAMDPNQLRRELLQHSADSGYQYQFQQPHPHPQTQSMLQLHPHSPGGMVLPSMNQSSPLPPLPQLPVPPPVSDTPQQTSSAPGGIDNTAVITVETNTNKPIVQPQAQQQPQYTWQQLEAKLTSPRSAPRSPPKNTPQKEESADPRTPNTRPRRFSDKTVPNWDGKFAAGLYSNSPSPATLPNPNALFGAESTRDLLKSPPMIPAPVPDKTSPPLPQTPSQTTFEVLTSPTSNGRRKSLSYSRRDKQPSPQTIQSSQVPLPLASPRDVTTVPQQVPRMNASEARLLSTSAPQSQSTPPMPIPPRPAPIDTSRLSVSPRIPLLGTSPSTQWAQQQLWLQQQIRSPSPPVPPGQGPTLAAKMTGDLCRLLRISQNGAPANPSATTAPVHE